MFKSSMMMRVLINRFHKGTPETLLSYLPENVAEEVLKQEIDSSDISALLKPAAEQIAPIHYSWLLPILQKVPSSAQVHLLHALPAEKSKRLGSLLGIAQPEHSLAPVAQHYLLSLILKNLSGIEKVLPLEYVPPTPLSNLGHYSKGDLVDLIGYLGIHDLAEEIRHIVDKKRIKGIYDCLSGKEQQYLRYCMHLKEKFIAPSLGLEKWSGDCEKLKSTLQARGLIRLGKALSGEHPDLIWHLAHILDTGRGQTLSKYYAKQPVAGITPALAAQVTNLMGILKKKGGT